MKKVLFIATVVKAHINAFHLPYLKWFYDNNYEVHVAAKNDFVIKDDCVIPYCDKFFDIEFARFPFNRNNFLAYKNLKDIIKENDYKIIHCHTPVGGVIGRLAARKENLSKVIYTAHGYHFWQGARIRNWILYFTIEIFLARFTDDVILINNDDYKLAMKYNMGKRIHYIPGVGINTQKFSNPPNNTESILNTDDINITFIGELTKNKNQLFLLNVISELKKEFPNIMLNLVGNGAEKYKLIEVGKKLKISANVTFLGFRHEISQILSESDLIVSASKREGLPVNIMEAMAAGKPIIASKCRGNRDLVINNYNGFLVDLSVIKFVNQIKLLIKNQKLMIIFSENSKSLSINFDLNYILPKYIEIYENINN